jgi:hypothetical protein
MLDRNIGNFLERNHFQYDSQELTPLVTIWFTHNFYIENNQIALKSPTKEDKTINFSTNQFIAKFGHPIINQHIQDFIERINLQDRQDNNL